MDMQKWKDLQDPADEDREREETESKDRSILEHYSAGSDKYHNGDWDGAIEHWGKALQLNPKDAGIWWHRGNAKAMKGHQRGAVKDYDESLRLDPGDASVWFSRGTSKMELGYEEGALADWEQAAQKDATRTEVWCCLGTTRLGRDDAAGAVSAADSALRADKDCAGAWGLRGTAKLALSDYVGAAADLRKALQLDSKLHWLSPKLREAIRLGGSEAEAATADDAELPEPKLKSDTDGVELLSKEELRERIRGVYERQNPEKLQDLDSLLDKYANSLPTMYRAVCKKYGEVPEVPAPKEAEKTESAAPQEAVAKTEVIPEVKRTHREVGNSFFKSGQFQEAIDEYKEACAAVEEGWVLALSNRAICHLKLGDYAEAANVADLCLQMEATKEVPLKVYLTKFKALAAQRKWLDAFALLRSLRARNLPKDVSLAAREEERSKRRERTQQCAEAANTNSDTSGQIEGTPLAAGQTLARAVEAVMPAVLDIFAAEIELIAADKAERVQQEAERAQQEAEQAQQLDVADEEPGSMAADKGAGAEHVPVADAESQLKASEAEQANIPDPGAAESAAAASATLAAQKVELLAVNPEDASSLKASLKDLSLVAPGCKFRVPDREAEGWDTDDSSDEEEEDDTEEQLELAVLYNVDLTSDMERWVTLIRRLVITEKPTIVTGRSKDQSLVQNEDILLALGCDIKCPTTLCQPSPEPGAEFTSAADNYHALVFYGGKFNERLAEDVKLMQRSFAVRGFDLPESAGESKAQLTGLD